ncbi:MAG TPA: thiolase family protein [Dehalococcoidia bacterium]|nr:thiolase family protein [Dehalococcoidia bacterium]
MRDVAVLGAGLHRFGRFPDKSLQDLGREAISNALDDAKVPFKDIEVAYVGRVLAGMGAGLNVVSEMGQTGIPVVNIEMACASSTSAFREAYLSVAHGIYDTALVVGFEKMQRGMLQISEGASYQTVMGLAVMPASYALQAQRYMADHEATPEMFGQVSVKSHKNGALNPYAQYQKAVTLDEVMGSRMIADPITLLQCSPTTDGAAAVVICAADKAAQYRAERSMTVVGWATGSGQFQADDGGESDAETGSGEVQRLASIAYERAGIGPEDVDVTQVHDAFSPGEIFTIEGLGLVREGEGARAIWEGRTEIDGDIPVNTDGGLLSRGHPIGATGAAMVTEIFRQLTGEAGPRQVKDGKANVGLIHNAGIGGVNILVFKS